MGKVDPKWTQDGLSNGWTMPPASWWKRLPLIRHTRAIWAQIAVERWYRYGPGVLGLRTGYDEWIIYGIWHGKERARAAALAEKEKVDAV